MDPPAGAAVATLFSAALSGVTPLPFPERFPGDANLQFEFSFQIPGTGASGIVRGFSPLASATFALPPGAEAGRVTVRARAMSADGTLSGYAVANVTVARPALTPSELSLAADRAQFAVLRGDVELAAGQLVALSALLQASAEPTDTATMLLRERMLDSVSDVLAVMPPSTASMEIASQALKSVVNTQSLSLQAQSIALFALASVAQLGTVISSTAASAILTGLSSLSNITLSDPAGVALGATGGGPAQYPSPGYAPPPIPRAPPLPPRPVQPPMPSPPLPPAPRVRSARPSGPSVFCDRLAFTHHTPPLRVGPRVRSTPNRPSTGPEARPGQRGRKQHHARVALSGRCTHSPRELRAGAVRCNLRAAPHLCRLHRRALASPPLPSRRRFLRICRRASFLPHPPARPTLAAVTVVGLSTINLATTNLAAQAIADYLSRILGYPVDASRILVSRVNATGSPPSPALAGGRRLLEQNATRVPSTTLAISGARPTAETPCGCCIPSCPGADPGSVPLACPLPQ